LKAQIFSLKDQAELYERLKASLKRELYEDIQVTNEVYDLAAYLPTSAADASHVDVLKIGRSYLELLRASMLRTAIFTLAVQHASDNWGYWDYEDDAKRAAYSLKAHYAPGGAAKLFPAVAVMDRMVMVPEGSHDAFDTPAAFSYLLRPLHLRGLLYVDFGNEEAIARAIRQVRTLIRSEIVSYGRRHMARYRTPTPNTQALAELLDVDNAFIEGLREEIMRPTPALAAEAVSAPELEVDEVSERVRLNEASLVTLKIRNTAQGAVGVVNVQVRAPTGVMREPPGRFSKWLDFSSGKAADQTVNFTVVPKAPYCPLEVLFLFDEASQAASFPRPVILEVVKEEESG
jgi:predicted RNA-binding Zn ribbon-like protein